MAFVVDLEHRDVRHKPVRRGAVPVLLTRIEEDAVAGPDHLERHSRLMSYSGSCRNI